MLSRHRRKEYRWWPTDEATLYAWWDFDDTSTLTLSSGDITAVTDKGSNGHDLSSAVDKYPSRLTAQQNGRTVARFDGVDEYMTNTYGETVNDLCFYMAGVKRRADGNVCLFLDGIGSSNRQLWYTPADNTTGFFKGGTAQFVAQQITANTAFVAWFRDQGGNDWAAQTNGTYELSTSTPGTQQMTGIAIASAWDFGTNGELDISEILVFDTDTNGAIHANVREYMLTKYNIDIGPAGG
ncbi:MAG: hypothetical protein ACW987_20660 [Candidatus Thorarchaeota archaeon]|jgi:hypothetical protein